MAEVILRSYNHDTDYAGLRSLLEEVGLFDPDYEAPERLEVASQRHSDMITVAVIDDGIVGSVYFQDGVIPTANRLAVRSKEQNRGIGSALLGLVETRARELGHRYLELSVSPKNATAHSFYENRGYTAGQTYTNMYRRIDV